MLLTSHYEMRIRKGLFFAGQMTGVEGYIESTASGFLAGYYAAMEALGIEDVIEPTSDTVIGSMANYIADSKVKNFVPMNANFGLVSAYPGKFKGKDKKKQKNQAIAARALEAIAVPASIIDKMRCSDGI